MWKCASCISKYFPLNGIKIFWNSKSAMHFCYSQFYFILIRHWSELTLSVSVGTYCTYSARRLNSTFSEVMQKIRLKRWLLTVASNIIINFTCMYINKKIKKTEKNWFSSIIIEKNSRWTLSSLVVVHCTRVGMTDAIFRSHLKLYSSINSKILVQIQYTLSRKINRATVHFNK